MRHAFLPAALALGALALSIASPGGATASEAYVRAGGRFTEGPNQPLQTAKHPEVIGLNVPEFRTEVDDYYRADAAVTYTTLKAHAVSGWGLNGVGTTGRATAQWTDALHLEATHNFLSTQLVGLAYAFYSTRADGTGRNGEVNLSLSVHSENFEKFTDAQDSYTFEPDEPSRSRHLFSGVQIPMEFFDEPLTLQMSLDVSSFAPHPAGNAEVDYGHTAVLSPIFIGDINGNPLPGLAAYNLQLVGEDGYHYPITLTPLPSLTADFDHSDAVNATDLGIWRDHFGAAGQLDNTFGDATGDGAVEGDDFLAWQSQLGASALTPAGTTIPEPTAAILALAAALALRQATRRRF